MKQLLILSFTALCVCFMSCSKEKESNPLNPDPKPGEETLVISESSIVVSGDSTQYAFTITSNTNWHLSYEYPQWYSITPTNGGPGTTNVSVQMPKNNTLQTIEGQISVRTRYLSKDIPLKQMTRSLIEKTVDIKVAGTLKDLISKDDFFVIGKLIISGELNVADIWTIVEMPQLTSLDLSNVNITTLPRILNNTLTHLALPKNLTTIGKNALSELSKITTIEIPESVTSIKEYAFLGCSSLKNIALPIGLKELDYSAFRDCVSLESINIPALEYVGPYIFQECVSLTNVTFDPQYKLNLINVGMFYNCTKLSSITIPNSVESIEYSTFEGCTALTTVTFEPNSKLQSFDHSSFKNCVKLQNITIPTSTTKIDASAFQGCTALTSVTFEPNSQLTSIYGGRVQQSTSKYTGAFSDCTSLTTFDASNCASLSTIGKMVFYNTKITTFKVGTAIPPVLEPDTFTLPDNATLKVPAASVEAYKAADVWKSFKTISAL